VSDGPEELRVNSDVLDDFFNHHDTESVLLEQISEAISVDEIDERGPGA